MCSSMGGQIQSSFPDDELECRIDYIEFTLSCCMYDISECLELVALIKCELGVYPYV